MGNAEWLTLIIALLALIHSLWATRATLKRTDDEIRRSETDREDAQKRYQDRVDAERTARIRREAEEVTFWTVATDDLFGSHSSPSGDLITLKHAPKPPEGGEEFLNSLSDGFRLTDHDNWRWVKLYIRNGNSFALRNVTVMNRDTEQELYRGSLVPGTHWFHLPAFGGGSGSTGPRGLGRILDGAPVDWVEFVDSRGVVWRRLQSGPVKRVDKEPEKASNFTP